MCRTTVCPVHNFPPPSELLVCYQPHRQGVMPGQKSIYETFLGWKSGKTTYVPLWERGYGLWYPIIPSVPSLLCPFCTVYLLYPLHCILFIYYVPSILPSYQSSLSYLSQSSVPSVHLSSLLSLPLPSPLSPPHPIYPFCQNVVTKIDLWRDFSAGVYKSLNTGDTVSHVGILDPAL